MNKCQSSDHRTLKALAICGNFIDGKISCNKCPSQHLCERGRIEKRIDNEFAKEIFEEIEMLLKKECITVTDDRGLKGYVTSSVHYILDELKKKYE